MLVDAERLAARVAELGAAITRDYAEEPPLLVAVLKGAMLFMSDLCRAIALPVDVDFMAVSSYGSATKTSGWCASSRTSTPSSRVVTSSSWRTSSTAA